MHKDTILPDQRNQIRESRQGDNVEIILEINAWIGRLLEQGVGELESHAGAAQIVKTFAGLRVHQRGATGPLT